MNSNKIIESTDKCVYLGILLHACTLYNDMSSSARDFNRSQKSEVRSQKFYLNIYTYTKTSNIYIYIYYFQTLNCIENIHV